MADTPIVLFTDFGSEGLYLGQVRLRIERTAPGVPVIDLVNNAPSFSPKPSAYLLAALIREITEPVICLAVIDPGVGSARRGLVLQTDRHTYVGPDNGLFALVSRRSLSAKAFEICWQPEKLSPSFHGRDLFAPIAAAIAGEQAWPATREMAADIIDRPDWPDDLPEVIYIDHYGNAVTGLSAAKVPADITIDGRKLPRRRSFYQAAPHEAFWYENSLGLAEIAVRDGSAADVLGLKISDPIVDAPAD